MRIPFRLAPAVCATLIALMVTGSAHGQPPIAGIDLTAALGELESARSRRARVDSEIEGLTARRDGARSQVRDRVRVLYRLRRAGVLPLSGGFEALLRHVARVDRLERMVERDVRSLSTLSRRVSALSTETARLAEEVQAAEMRAESARAQQEEQARSLAVLGNMIEDPAAWSGPSGFGLRYADGEPLSGFAARRGQLPLPVSGSATVVEAVREGGQGLELSAAPGVRVRAVEGGRVAYAAPHPAYQQLVILDHGGDYFTVYGGLAALAVGPGHTVPRDAVLGSAGTAPVFFQVRRGSRPLPARAWLGI